MNVIKMASAVYATGVEPDQAVQTALDQNRKVKVEARKPAAKPYPPEQYYEVAKQRFSDHLLNTLTKVPRNVRLEAWQEASARALWARTNQRDPITVTPTKPESEVVNG